MKKHKTVHKRTQSQDHLCVKDFGYLQEFECCSYLWKRVNCKRCLAKRTEPAGEKDGN